MPVLRDVGNRDAADLRHGLDRMRADIRARTIAPEEMRGNTITLSNFGMIAGRYAALSWCRRPWQSWVPGACAKKSWRPAACRRCTG